MSELADSPAVRAAVETERRFGSIEKKLDGAALVAEAKYKRIEEHLTAILAQVKITNGSVADLKAWRDSHSLLHATEVDAAGEIEEIKGNVQVLMQAGHDAKVVQAVWHSHYTWAVGGGAMATMILGLAKALGLL